MREKARPRKRRSWFSILVCFLFLFLVPLEIGGLRELWDFLEEYQLSLPENAAQKGLELFQKREIETLSRFAEYTPHPLDRVSSLDGWLEDYLGFYDGDAEYTLIPRTGTSSQKRYVVARDGIKIAELLLTPTAGETKRGFPLWEVSDIDIAPVSGRCGVEIIVPQGVEVTVNGIPLDAEYLVENALPAEVSGYQEMPPELQPTVMKYRVEGLLEPPELSARSKGDGSCVIEEIDPEGENLSRYQVTHFAGDSLRETAGLKAEYTAQLYARFITKDAQLEALLPYLLQGGPLYNQLYGFSNAWYIDHDSYEFQDFEMSRFILYDGSHFSCDVDFNYIIRMGNQVYEYPSAYTLYFVNSAEGWQAAALEIR